MSKRTKTIHLSQAQFAALKSHVRSHLGVLAGRTSTKRSLEKLGLATQDGLNQYHWRITLAGRAFLAESH